MTPMFGRGSDPREALETMLEFVRETRTKLDRIEAEVQAALAHLPEPPVAIVYPVAINREFDRLHSLLQEERDPRIERRLDEIASSRPFGEMR